MKMRWKVAPQPTGRYRSFEWRGWPQLEYEDGQIAAGIRCSDSYSRRIVKSGSHSGLSVHLYDYSMGVQQRRCLVIKERFTSLDKAKDAAIAVLKNHPEFSPNKSRNE